MTPHHPASNSSDSNRPHTHTPHSATNKPHNPRFLFPHLPPPHTEPHGTQNFFAQSLRESVVAFPLPLQLAERTTIRWFNAALGRRLAAYTLPLPKFTRIQRLEELRDELDMQNVKLERYLEHWEKEKLSICTSRLV